MKNLMRLMLVLAGVAVTAIAEDVAAPAAAPVAAEVKAAAPEAAVPAAPAEVKVEQPGYMCDMCHVMSLTAGKCPKCGMDMTKTHVLAVKDGMAYCCGCGSDCTCKPTDDSMTKCSCGKEIKKVSVKGMYCCGSEGGPKCNMLSDKPGTCKCGKAMKKVE